MRAPVPLVLLLAGFVASARPTPAAAADAIPWTRDATAAFAAALERRGPVMILFTGPNCGPKQLPGEVARGGAVAKDLRDKCDLMESDVLSHPDVVAATERFVPLLVEQNLIGNTDERTLERRYKVYTIPTVLVVDPWGNEVLRLVGLVPRDKFVGVLRAMPADFAPLEAAGRLLKDDAENGSALVSAAAFYRQRGLLPIADTLYERALATRDLKSDLAARHEAALARGTILLQLRRPGDAAKLFEKTVSDAPDGPQGDALRFGWLMAELQDGHLKDARKVFADLDKRFPASAYTAKARENLEAAARH